MEDLDESSAPPTHPSPTAAYVPPDRAPAVAPDEELVYDEYVDLEEHPGLPVVIAEAVAEVREESAPELLPNLQEAVDPDGLRNVFRHHPGTPHRSGWVTFFFHDCRLVLDSNQRLRIYDRRPADDLDVR